MYWYACSRCDVSAKDDAAATDKYYTSTTAGEHIFTEKIEDAAHYVAGTGTDCQSVKKYYYDCAYCDQIGTTTWDSTTYGEHNYAAVWSRDESGHWHECSLCHDKKDKAVHTPGAAATETTPQKCTECDYIITPALGHTHSLTKVDAKTPTCTEGGNSAYYTCSGCSKWYEDAAGSAEIFDHSSVEISALGHDYTKKVETEAYLKTAASNCTECNVYWYACSRCNANAKDDAEATDKYYTSTTAGEHSYADTWSSDADDHWHECSLCHAKKDVAAHIAGEWIIDTPATAATAGTKHKACTECGYVMENATIPATGSSGGSSGGGVSTYAITVDSAKNGDVTVSPRNASKGTTVTLTVEPDKGYTLETLTVTDKNGDEIALTNKGDGKYTFKMPAGKVYVEATFMEDNSMLNFFVDVFPGDYYYDAVLWAAKNGITGGVDAAHFAPNATCTRAQVVTFLWRAAGSPAPKSSMIPFTDVPAGSYYEQAVLWAVENGITDGTSATTFSPDAVCSRGQIVTFLWRSQKSPASDSVNPFADVAADAYYNSAVLWAVTNGITDGTSITTFSPAANCTRAQIVTFLYRCLG
ncbi:MAG: S-layer homology domain-containing protein [Oscillospiraceae bacterium]|nr:S-layer homology domain-containing protein [Oscillospiraceae bacterium]